MPARHFLQNVPLFSDLSSTDLNELASITTEIHLPKGEYLFKEGHIGDYAYIISEGNIKILTHSGGYEVQLAIRGVNEVIGEMSLLDAAPRMASAKALTDVTLLSIHRDSFTALLEHSPSATRNILYNVTTRWRNTEAILRQREQQVLDQSRKLENALTALQQANEELEERVQNRTAELEQANDELQKYRNHLEELVLNRTAELKQANQKLRGLNNKLQDDLLMARQIQQGLLPPARPDWCSPDVVCYSAPAQEVGGDFYAYHTFDPMKNNVVVAVGDVSGKGMPAALLMAVSLTAFQLSLAESETTTHLLPQLDKIIEPYTRTTRQNCALCCVELNQDGSLVVSNAGCVMPLHKRVDGSVSWLEAGGTPLGVGIDDANRYIKSTSRLNKGDLIILTSDGVIEANANSGEMFGFDRLERVVEQGPTDNAQAMLDHIHEHLNTFTDGHEPHDDITIVVLKY